MKRPCTTLLNETPQRKAPSAVLCPPVYEKMPSACDKSVAAAAQVNLFSGRCLFSSFLICFRSFIGCLAAVTSRYCQSSEGVGWWWKNHRRGRPVESACLLEVRRDGLARPWSFNLRSQNKSQHCQMQRMRHDMRVIRMSRRLSRQLVWLSLAMVGQCSQGDVCRTMKCI